jgi:peptidoglycan hydrolase-like protein with peptidoglycan-binding domain
MRQVTPRRAHHRIIALVLLSTAICLSALAAPAFASSPAPQASSESPAPEASSASPVPAASPSAAAESPVAEPAPAALTCVLSRAVVAFGGSVTVSGSLSPAAEGQEVVVTLAGAEVGAALTDASGAFELTFTPRRSGDVVASLSVDPSVASGATALGVKPKVGVSHGSLVPFLSSRFVLKVAPSAYTGVVTVKVVHRGAVVGRYRARVRDGRAVFQVPLRGVDGFTLTFALPAAGGLVARSFQTKVGVRARTLSVGSSGRYVKGMLTGLRRLAIRIPGMGTRFSTRVKDSVMAFQKAYRLPRTYVFNTQNWRKLDGARRIRPRYAGPSTHIEVDKGRQILMIVKGGKVFGLIAVSTGATGNTPEGRFRIQQKHPYTTSGYGGILVRTMGFVGDFAIHGYSPVPPYPASHGCIREPIWACYWTYDQSWVGETLYVYR